MHRVDHFLCAFMVPIVLPLPCISPCPPVWTVLIRLLYDAMRDSTILLTICLSMTMFGCMKWNSLSVTRELALDREAVLKQNLETLTKKLKGQQRKLVVLQKQEVDNSVTAVADGEAGGS